MDDLLKDAIADAKAVRETALANAKMALEEAFTPRLKSMLSQKIQNEMEGDEMEDAPEEEAGEEMEAEAEVEDEMEMEDEAEEADEEMEMEMEDEADEAEAEAEEEEELDLESILRELEDEVNEEEFETETETETEDEGEEEFELEIEDDEVEGAEDEEELDLEEVLKALTEDDEELDEADDVAALKSDLEEHRNVVKYLRSKLNEVNLLNAKLLFSNKLFKSYGLSNEQKVKVVETFDRAHNLREVKLVYSTLAESFNGKVKIKENNKGSASKAIASTKPKTEVISEGSDMRNRFKKLANIL